MVLDKNKLETTRPRPMYDKDILRFGTSLVTEEFQKNDDIHKHFLDAFDKWIHNTTLNQYKGLFAFPQRDVITGVTHFIDELYMQHPGRVVTIENDYMYHTRLGLGEQISWQNLGVGDILIFSMPFPYYGDKHPDTDKILDKAATLGVPVHIDSAWVGCVRNIDFNYNHAAIQSVGFSLSKGLALGDNRIGVRYARYKQPGAISIMNDYHMYNKILMWYGMKFMNHFGHDYFWTKYEKHYIDICNTLGLEQTNAIHLAWDNGPVGVRALLRELGDV